MGSSVHCMPPIFVGGYVLGFTTNKKCIERWYSGFTSVVMQAY